MPKQFQKLASDFAIHTNDSSGSTLELGKSLINIGVRKILGIADWTFNKDSKSYSTGTYVQTYTIPYNANKVEYVKQWVGGVWYTPKEVKNETDWVRLNSVTVYSTIPTHWYYDERNRKVNTFPISAGVGGTVVVGFNKKFRDLSVSDYSDGSITVAANGTVFTAPLASWGSIFAGRYLQPYNNNSLSDGYWFEVVEVPLATTLFTRESANGAIASGSYVISELIPLPDGFEDIPLWYSLDKYYQIKEKPTLAREYERMWKEGVDDLLMRDQKTVNGIMEKQDISQQDPNSNPWALYLQ